MTRQITPTTKPPVLLDARKCSLDWKTHISAVQSGSSRCKTQPDGSVTASFSVEHEGSADGELSAQVKGPVNTAQYLPPEAELSFRYKIQPKQGQRARDLRLSIRLVAIDGVTSWQTLAAGPQVRPSKWQRGRLQIPMVPSEPEIRNIYNGQRVKPGLKEIRFGLSSPQRLRASLEIAGLRVVRLQPEEPAYEPRQRELPSRRKGALVLTTTSNSFYRAQEIAGRVFGDRSVTVGKYRSHQLPLTHFPKAFRELARYEVVILADVDPFKVWQLGERHLRDLCDYVVSGGGLLLLGGTCSLGSGRHHDLVAPFLDLLPVTVKAGAAMVDAGSRASLEEEHVVTKGLKPADLGRVGQLHRVRVRKRASVPLSADGDPLLVAGQVGQGRVCVLTAIPDIASGPRGHFYISPGYQPLMERALRWCARRRLSPKASVRRLKTTAPAIEVRFPYGKNYIEEGRDACFAVVSKSRRPADVSVTVTSTGRERVHAESLRRVKGKQTIELPAEALRPGTYRVTARPKSGQKAQADLHVIKKIDREALYPIIGTVRPVSGQSLCLNEAGVEAEVEDLRKHNVNTIALTGLSLFDKWGQLPHAAQMVNHAERYALLKGMAIHYEYEQLPLLPGRSGEGPDACPNSPNYREAARRRLSKLLDVAAHIPNLLTIDPWDEPSVGWPGMDLCDGCQESADQRYGAPITRKRRVEDASPAERRVMHDHLNDCVSRSFREVHQYKKELGLSFKTFLNYCGMGLSTVYPHRFTNVLDWSQAGDAIGCDYYPYWYPSSTEVRFNDFHYGLSHLRNVAQHYGVEFGFYVELDDRNYPIEAPHVRASNECAYTALAHGAHFLSLFIHVPFGAGTRHERWDTLGHEFGKILKSQNLLVGTSRPASPVAILFPYADFTLSNVNQSYPSNHAYELLLRAAGECDVINEGTLAAGSLRSCRALFVPKVNYLSEVAHRALVEFVQEGGLAFLESVPQQNERGEDLKVWKKLRRAAKSRHRVAGVRLLEASVGAGAAFFAESAVADAFRERVEFTGRGAAAPFWRDLGSLLRARGVRAEVESSHPEVEAAVRRGEDRELIVIASHSDATENVTFRFPGQAATITDTATRAAVRTRSSPRGVEFTLRLEPYAGRILEVSQP